MSESKTVKINLKKLIEDLIFAYADGNEELIIEIKDNFENVYIKQSGLIQQGMLQFLRGNQSVKDNNKILKYFNSFSK